MSQQDGFVVFWMEQLYGDVSLTPSAKIFAPTEMVAALAFVESMRKFKDIQFVTMVSQNSNSVGRAGVDSIVDGKCPDGHVYDWNKSSRIGQSKRSDKVIVFTDEQR